MMSPSDLIGKARNRIKLVGVELEGGWNKIPDGSEPPIRDGSVIFGTSNEDIPREIRDLLNSYTSADQERGARLHRQWVNSKPKPPKYVGEMPSAPMKPEEMPGWVKKFYPQEVNETCGLHLHMSFNTLLTYQRLMTPEYEKAVLDYLATWGKDEKIPPEHHFWDRLKGLDVRKEFKGKKSEFCRVGSNQIDAQARIAKKNWDHHSKVNRYTAINYSYGTHGTIECRVLPMFAEAAQAVSALQAVMEITNAFALWQIKGKRAPGVRLMELKKAESLSLDIQVTDERGYEEYTERL